MENNMLLPNDSLLLWVFTVFTHLGYQFNANITGFGSKKCYLALAALSTHLFIQFLYLLISIQGQEEAGTSHNLGLQKKHTTKRSQVYRRRWTMCLHFPPLYKSKYK